MPVLQYRRTVSMHKGSWGLMIRMLFRFSHCRAPPRHAQPGNPAKPELLLLAWKGTGSKALRLF